MPYFKCSLPTPKCDFFFLKLLHKAVEEKILKSGPRDDEGSEEEKHEGRKGEREKIGWIS